MKRATGALVLALILASGTRAAAQTSDVECQLCHGDRDFVQAAAAQDTTLRLLVTDSLLRDSRHARLGCGSCHTGQAQGYPHPAGPKAAACQTCHVQAGRDWAASVHARNAAAQGDAPTCVGCHGSHAVYGAADRRSPTHPLNAAALCGRCHADARIIGTYFMAPEQAQAREAVAQYYQTVHGSALTNAGLVVSATCNDCHGAHRVLPAADAASSVHRDNIAETCGTCHAGVLEVYEGSAHGAALRERGGRDGRPAPVCTDCHTSHGIVRASDPQWFVGVVEECGTCHQRLYDTYFDTYHGKVTQLGFGLTAKCSDCHTAHDVRPASDPASSVYPLNLVATCATCHPAANASFVKYYSHGDHRDRQRYPVLFWAWAFMTTLLASIFLFFGAHTVLWLGRLGLDWMRTRSAGAGKGAS
ncbi:MAG TPA: cytochrome c3 family protein [Gemmatimonadales bacterium]|nr:cytochrome c3 family protein [Gemmatimonadales bacterium]